MRAAKRFFVSFVAVLPIFPIPFWPTLPPLPPIPPVPNKPVDSVIIKLNDNAALNDILQAHNLTVEKRIDALNVIVAKTQRDASQVAANIMKDARVAYAEPNFVAQAVRLRTPFPRHTPTPRPTSSPTPTPSASTAPTSTPEPTVTPSATPQPTYVPNDTLYSQQWALAKISWNKLDPTMASLNATSDTTKTTVAVVDTGVNYNHPDLVGRVDTAHQIDYVNKDNDAMDDEGHGTHVAGIITAATNNNQGVAGVGYNDLQVLPIKVLDNQGYGYYSDIAQGITYAADLGVPVINLSLGGSFPSQTLQDAVNYAWQKGSMIVAAAGNSGNTAPLYPAYYSNAIAVGASDQNDRRASFSTYGFWVDIVAPGVNIISTTGNTYESWSGTSMATPHVSALAGLIMSQQHLNNQQTRTKLETTADSLPNEPTFTSGNFGKGRINVYRALTQ